MRLICPNCDAEYQVDDAAIPDGGRDVQCSNCGHAWFQLPAEVEIAREAEAALFGEDAAVTVAPPTVAPSNVAAASPELAPSMPAPADPLSSVLLPDAVAPADPEVVRADDAVAGDADASVSASVAGPGSSTPSRQTLAESVLSVLREEAERETAVRRDEAPVSAPDRSGIETQTEFGLDDALNAASSTAAARHIARLKGADPDLPATTETKTAARRDLLPDIEEINSTLRANSERAREADAEIDALPDIKPRKRGFRSGFVLMMIVAVMLAMTYVMAPRIIAQMPGSAPAMKAYVAGVDRGRLWLDGMMQSASGALRKLSGDGN